jgi:hypothetical protein
MICVNHSRRRATAVLLVGLFTAPARELSRPYSQSEIDLGKTGADQV